MLFAFLYKVLNAKIHSLISTRGLRTFFFNILESSVHLSRSVLSESVISRYFEPTMSDINHDNVITLATAILLLIMINQTATAIIILLSVS